MSMSGAPLLVVPWQEDFLQHLLRFVIEDTDGDISRAVCIFPHSRPRRYLSFLLSRETSIRLPALMPRMHTVSGIFASLSARILARPAWSAGLLDRVGLLLACVREESGDALSPVLGSARLFFPWGVRLASLFEECFSQHRKPVDFYHMEGQVSPFAELLLSRLGGIFTRYTTALKEREWTSPGYEASLVADYLQANGMLPAGEGLEDASRPVYIAGFHALTGTENLLFRHLWSQRNARVLLHADSRVAHAAGGEKAHWSCGNFVDWAKSWSTTLELLPGTEDSAPAGRGRIRYCQGFDLHSQLGELQRELAGTVECFSETAFSSGQSEDGFAEALTRDNDFLGQPAGDLRAETVVVLPDSGLLMPVLHHLPLVDVNISMGYPLSRSPLFRLVDTLARLQERRKNQGYYWRDLVDLIRHPYLKMLEPQEEEPADGEEEPAFLLRAELHSLEKALREQGRKYLDPRVLCVESYQLLSPEELPPLPVLVLLDKVLATVTTAFENLARPADLASALEGVCDLLLTYGSHLWKRFPIDAECLLRLRQSLIPELARSELAGERFPPETLFAILRNLMEAERVPFEADPLVGLQIMGMLETRLLSFRRVILVETVEDTLPGSAAGDPLLPEALRPELGLPALSSREQVAAYNFFRLMEGAEDILLLWQEGAESSGIQEQKKKKSRFAEELLWKEEKKIKRLLRPEMEGGEDGPLRVLPATIVPIVTGSPGISVTPPVRDLLRRLLERPVSASFLDSYLRCPVRFFYERAVRLAKTEEITEGDDPMAVGELFHEVLQDLYTEHLGVPLPGGEELVALLGEDLRETLFASPRFAALSRALPADSFAMLAVAGQKRLGDFLRHQPPTTVLALETPLAAAFKRGEQSWSLTGKADRLDMRTLRVSDDANTAEGEGVVILDYKTGKLPFAGTGLFQNLVFFTALEEWLLDRRTHDGDELLRAIADSLGSIQLPFYLFLFSLAAEQERLPAVFAGRRNAGALDARWVELAVEGKEISFFKQDASLDARWDAVFCKTPVLIEFLLRHMLESPMLLPRAGGHCFWCSGKKLCTVSVASQ